MTIGPALIKGIKKTNVVVIRGQGQVIEAPPKRDPYTMKINRGRNSYTYGGFRHMAHHCRNRRRGRPMEERKIKYGGGRIEEIQDYSNNLKEVENLELLN